MKKKICFVCTENTCRSQMAEKILSTLIKGNKIFKIESAGLYAPKDAKTNPKAIVALKNLGINQRQKMSKQLTQSAVKKYNLIITMTKEQKNAIISKNVYTFAELVGKEDILDPYGQNQEAYDMTAKKIYEYCLILAGIINKLGV